MSNSAQTRRVSLVNQEVQTMTLDNVTSDETNKFTQNTSTEDLNSASHNNTSGLGEFNNSSTEQIKNKLDTQMSLRDQIQYSNSKYPCHIKTNNLTHEWPEYNRSFDKKYINFLHRAVKDENIYINENVNQCYFNALQDYQLANFNMVETQDQLDVIFLRNNYDFNYWASTATSSHLEELQELRFGVGQREDVFIIGNGYFAQLQIQPRCDAMKTTNSGQIPAVTRFLVQQIAGNVLSNSKSGSVSGSCMTPVNSREAYKLRQDTL
ncbi:unnamed protein product [Rotaria magnacalcarata]|nr:unnamed protein product [Rotaria magnacalcarata]